MDHSKESAAPCLEAADFAALRDLGVATDEYRALRHHVLGCVRCQDRELSLVTLLRWMPGGFVSPQMPGKCSKSEKY